MHSKYCLVEVSVHCLNHYYFNEAKGNEKKLLFKDTF